MLHIFRRIFLLATLVALPLNAQVPSIPGAPQGAPGPGDAALQQVQAFVRRTLGDTQQSATKPVSEMQVRILACVGVNGTYDVRELGAARISDSGAYKVQAKGDDYEVSSSGTVQRNGRAILVDADLNATVTLSKEKAPPSGQKPHIEMGIIRTNVAPGKPKYFAGAQAGLVTAPGSSAKAKGVSLDMFIVVH